MDELAFLTANGYETENISDANNDNVDAVVKRYVMKCHICHHQQTMTDQTFAMRLSRIQVHYLPWFQDLCQKVPLQKINLTFIMHSTT